MDLLSLEDPGKFLRDFRCQILHDLADDLVIAGVGPKRAGSAAIREVISDGPGVIDLRCSEAVTVIPAADLLHMIFFIIVRGHFPDFFFRKAEIRAVFFVQNGIHGGIIQPAEEIFL